MFLAFLSVSYSASMETKICLVFHEKEVAGRVAFRRAAPPRRSFQSTLVLSSCALRRSGTLDGVFRSIYAQKHVRFRDVPNVRDGREDGDERQRGGRQGEQRVRANPNGVTHDVDDNIYVMPFFCLWDFYGAFFT